MHTRRWAATGALAAVLLATGLSASAASAGPEVPDPTACQSATAVAKTQRSEATQADADATTAENAATDAKTALAVEQASNPDGETAEQREARLTPYQAAVTKAQTSATEARAQADTEATQANAADAEAKQACTISAPPAEVDHSDGVDAKIILSPNVCARAVIRETRTHEGTLPVLVRVIVLIPCPPVTPTPPVVAPAPGQRVVVITNTAPKPITGQGNLTVTG